MGGARDSGQERSTLAMFALPDVSQEVLVQSAFLGASQTVHKKRKRGEIGGPHKLQFLEQSKHNLISNCNANT